MPFANLPGWVRGDARMVTPGKRDRLTAEIARATWLYEPDTGLLRWKTKRYKTTIKPGDIAGCETKPRGEIVVGYGSPPGNNYKATHIIWLIVTGEWPAGEISPRDRDPSNNRWDNLRASTHTQTQQYRPKLANNTSGYKGVTLHRPSGRWFAFIRANGQQNFLGAFDTAEEAALAYQHAAGEWHGEFAAF